MGIGVKVSIENEEGFSVITLEGRVDASTTPVLERKIESLLHPSSIILIDCSLISYLSSAGMRLFLSITRKMDAKKGKILFFGIREEVMEIIKMAGFDRILKIYDTKKDALKIL